MRPPAQVDVIAHLVLRELVLDTCECDVWEGHCSHVEEKRLFLGTEPSELRDNVSNLFCFCLTEESEGVYSNFIVNDDDGLAEMSLPQAPPLPIPPTPCFSEGT